jgi:Ca2+-binding EF-hand superfamily protein
MTSRTAEAITELFVRYDTEKTGKLTKAQLQTCLTDLNGRPVDENELGNVTDLMDAAEDGTILLSEFIRVIDQFFKYC